MRGLHGLKFSFDNLGLMKALKSRILDQIQQAGGWIGFDEFMQAALYTPGLGYYSGGGVPFSDPQAVGRGDFVTSPMLGPWMADAIWSWAQPLSVPSTGLGRQPARLRIREFGGGRGDLAAELMRRTPAGAIDFEMLETSADLQQMQRERTHGLGAIRWARQLEPGFQGLVIANEVLDAMPVKCFEWMGPEGVREWGVALADAHRAADNRHEFLWAAQPAGHLLADAVAVRAAAAAARGQAWDCGYRGEWSPWFGPWLQSLFESMDVGAVLLIDYGFARPELDHPGRCDGTICAHYQHRRIDAREELLRRIGLQDLTAHVDFTEVAQQARSVGFDVSGFVTQARFLINSGLLQRAQPVIERTTDPADRARLLHQLQMLVSESEMGEVFKVLLLTKGLETQSLTALTDPAFASGDRLASLFSDQ